MKRSEEEGIVEFNPFIFVDIEVEEVFRLLKKGPIEVIEVEEEVHIVLFFQFNPTLLVDPQMTGRGVRG